MHPTQRPTRQPTRCRGFTLIEIMAVLVIIGIMAGAVVLVTTSRVHSARMADLLGRVQHLDQWTRRDARRFGRPAQIVFDLDDNSGYRAMGDARDRRLSVPGGFRLEQVRLAQAGEVAHGQAAVDCSNDGRSGSYAVLVTGPGDARAWVLFAGLSGDSAVLASDDDVAAALAGLGPGNRGLR